MCVYRLAGGMDSPLYLRMYPTVSIVTPSYNQGKFIAETIESVISQEGNFYVDYIIMDGGSTDGSLEIINKYDQLLKNGKWRVGSKGITYSFTSNKDKGQSDALKKGFSKAVGEILCWVNSDDRLTPAALQHVVTAWTINGGDLLVTGGCAEDRGARGCPVHYPSFQKAYNMPEEIPLERLVNYPDCWLKGHFFYQPEVFFPRSLYKLVGGINDSLRYAMDYDLWIRLSIIKARIVVINETLAIFRFHPEQKTSQWDKVIEEAVSVANKHLCSTPVLLEDKMKSALIRSNSAFLTNKNKLTFKILSNMRRVFNVLRANI